MASDSKDEFVIRESESVKIALKVLDKLLADNMTRQLYAKEIRMLFDLIGVQTLPPVIINAPKKEES